MRGTRAQLEALQESKEGITHPVLGEEYYRWHIGNPDKNEIAERHTIERGI